MDYKDAPGTGLLPYDDSKITSISSYANRLIDHTLRELLELEDIDSPIKKRGSFGSTLETQYFKIPANTLKEPDFRKVGVELKSTPMKRNANGKLVAKERLVLSKINFTELVEESWESSSLLEKTASMLIVAYLYEREKNPVDYRILLTKLWGLPDGDIKQFQLDWELIRQKVADGKAHEISGRDTIYLEACTKSANGKVVTSQPFSDTKAKPRAWALKASYMTTVLSGLKNAQEIERESSEQDLGLMELLTKRFAPLIGKSIEELATEFDIDPSKKPKNITDLLTKRILGISQGKKIMEFEKAGLKTKTIRLQRNGYPKESISFPAFSFAELATTPFEKSDFYSQLDQKYLFVVYREDKQTKGKFNLSQILLWQMPEDDFAEAKKCYELMQKRTIAGTDSYTVGSKENRCCHVRPHGRNSEDTLQTPNGDFVVKKSFWLNSRYIGNEIARMTETTS